MSCFSPTLHMLCGKIAAGKSTLAARLARQDSTVLIAEDAWLSALFADELSTMSDYVRCTTRLRGIMGPHITAVLNAGVSVVLDFAANTVAQRRWMRSILEQSDAAHQLHVLTAPDELCLARLQERNRHGDHPFAVTEAQFYQFSRHFVVPSAEEGFAIVWHDPET